LPKLSWLALLLLLIASLAEAQLTSDPAAEKCTLEGQVVKAGTGEPLKRARVFLRPAESFRTRHFATTDTSGRFLLKDIEPGRYRLAAERNGYVRQQYGQQGPDHPGTILTLAPGQHFRDVVFRLLPTAVIAGRIYDEDGEPTPRVFVEALLLRYHRGRRQLSPAEQATTNDLGEYRLFGLAPGRYRVSATYSPGTRRVVVGGGIASTRTDDPRGELGYIPTLYPGTTDPSRATPLELGAGDEVGGVDFTLGLTRTVRVRGQVFNSITGGPSRGDVMIQLVSRDPALRSWLGRSTNVVVDGKGGFELLDVTPGSYVLSGTWWDRENEKRYTGRTQFEVGTTDVEGITLVIGLGVDVEGRVSVEGRTKPFPALRTAPSNPATSPERAEGQLDSDKLRVSLEPPDDMPVGWEFSRVREDGSFRLRNVGDGEYRVSLRGLPADFYLKEARLGNDDVLEGLAISGGRLPGPLELLLSPNGGRIEGTVRGEEQQALGGVRVVLVPEPRRRHQFHLYKTSTTDQYGRFTLRGIPPGEYKLFAWEEVESGAYQDSEFLHPYEKHGEDVRVQEGETINVELDAISSNPFQR
jgi:protocatechuate 3,4-dioxygenase beta subunit